VLARALAQRLVEQHVLAATRASLEGRIEHAHLRPRIRRRGGERIAVDPCRPTTVRTCEV
jgi:hypothetical protein